MAFPVADSNAAWRSAVAFVLGSRANVDKA